MKKLFYSGADRDNLYRFGFEKILRNVSEEKYDVVLNDSARGCIWFLTDFNVVVTYFNSVKPGKTIRYSNHPVVYGFSKRQVQITLHGKEDSIGRLEENLSDHILQLKKPNL